MIVNEKALCKAMNTARKGVGYIIEGGGPEDDMLTIYTENWMVRIDTYSVPRKVLALIVEHTGGMPADLGPVRVEKERVQSMFENEAKAPWKMKVMELSEGNVPKIFRTAFTWEGMQIWQDAHGHRLGSSSGA